MSITRWMDKEVVVNICPAVGLLGYMVVLMNAKELMLLNCGVGEDSWESLGLQEIKPVHPKGDQSWIFIGRTDAEAETSILWSPDAKSQLIGKDPDAGEDWGLETTEDEMVGWHHQHDRHKFEYAPGVGDGQGSLVCFSPWGPWAGNNWMTELNWERLVLWRK